MLSVHMKAVCSAHHLTCRRSELRDTPPAKPQSSAAARSCALARSAHVNNMSRLRFAIVLAAFSFVVLLVAASATPSSSRPPEVYSVGVGDGDETGRAGNDGDDTPTLRKWAAMTQRFSVRDDTMEDFNAGDVLDFEGSSDSVLLVRQGDFERCSAASPVHRFVADGGGDTRFTLARLGLFYFISGAPARCEAGERLVVRVVDPLIVNNISGAPTPAPGTEPTDTLSKRRPLTIAQMQMVAGAVGFAAGFITMFLIVGFFICRP